MSRLPRQWNREPLNALAEIVSGGTPTRTKPEFWGGDIPWVTPTDISKESTNVLRITAERITAKGLAGSSAALLPPGTILLTSRASIGAAKIAQQEVSTNQGFKSLVPNHRVQGKFLFYQVVRSKNDFLRLAAGSTFLEISRKDCGRVQLSYPSCKTVQTKIAEILETIDDAIEQTEALIGKYERIKAGMMQDLFTRGLTPDGKLRPPRETAPDLYQETEIGWLPKEWEPKTLDAIKDTLIDGPFGSNLKTEHYTSSPQVRVIRLQNIKAGSYSDADKSFITFKHAGSLARNRVLGGDVLIAGLGDETHPVGRACLYPETLPSAVNKADCFRLRCREAEMTNGFAMYYLNTESAVRQINRYKQGVTRQRINTGNLKRIFIGRPHLDEQALILRRLTRADSLLVSYKTSLQKLRQQKSGLMDDLLTGRVPVTV